MAVAIGFVFIFLIALATFFRPRLSLKSIFQFFSKKPVQKEIGSPLENHLDGYPSVTSAELQLKITDGDQMTLLDIRENADFEEEHIIGSTNVPLGVLGEKIYQFPAGSAIVIGYGADDNDVAEAMRLLSGNTRISVKFLRGGITEWKKNKNKLISWGNPSSFEEQSKVTYVSKLEIKKIIEDQTPIFILDTSRQNVFSASHLPNAINIPVDLLEARRNEIPQNREIIVYGETELSGFQSGVKLYDLGFPATRVFRGGMREWSKQETPETTAASSR